MKNNDHMDKVKSYLKTNPTVAPQVALGIIAMVILLLLALILLVPRNQDPYKAPYYQNQYVKITKPAGWGWQAEKQDDTFVFRQKNGSAAIVLEVDVDEKHSFLPINLSPLSLATITEQALIDYGLPNKALSEKELNVRIIDAWEDLQEWYYSAASFEFKVKNYDGIGFMFYIKKLRFVYLGMWREGQAEEYRNIVRTCKNYLRVLAPHNEPLFIRPFIDNDKTVDSHELLREARNWIKLAKRLWNQRDTDINNIRLALEAFQNAFRKMAESGDWAALAFNFADTMDLYRKCQEARKAQIDQMVSQIVQQARLENNKLAMKRARILIEMSSLDNESKIREWAKQQYNILKNKVGKDE